MHGETGFHRGNVVARMSDSCARDRSLKPRQVRVIMIRAGVRFRD